MGNSPSKNSYAIPSTKNPSTTHSATSGSEELNANEPNDPDDSRSLPTQNIKISKEAPGEPRNNSKRNNTNQAYDLEIDMSFAKALGGSGGSNSSATSTSSSMSLKRLMTPPSGVTDSSYMYGSSPEDNLGLDKLPPIKEEQHASLAATSSCKKTVRAQAKAKALARRGIKSGTEIPNPCSASNRIILKRNAHDPQSERLDVDDMIDKLLQVGQTRYYQPKDFPFRSWEVQLICARARELFLDQPSLLRLQAPIKIVGDVHGQFTDLLRILKLSGVPQDTSYLFLGDYVDRGKQSLETMLLLLCYKVKYPDRFFMLRGNHESANVTKMYGFYDECKRRLSIKCWKMFVDVFNTLPLAAIVQDKIFCVHGGISPDLASMMQVDQIARPTDIPEEGLLTDLLWSDPDPQVPDWSVNDRGVSVTFGKRNVYDFCTRFKFDLVVRGHMVVEDGYEFFARKKFVTVFSAPNYCGEFQNWGAVMSVTTGLMCSFELLKPHGLKDKPAK